MNGLFPLWDVTVAVFFKEKYSIQDDEYDYYDCLQAHLIDAILCRRKQNNCCIYP